MRKAVLSIITTMLLMIQNYASWAAETDKNTALSTEAAKITDKANEGGTDLAEESLKIETSDDVEIQQTDNTDVTDETTSEPAPISTQEEQNTDNTEDADNSDEPEEDLALDVFAPEFMASLRICREDSEANGQRVFEIKGIRNGKCHLTYGNYILNVPTSVLGNIHSFDDLQTLLKNKDMVRYKYLPEYTYEGLIYALDACAHKEKYYGVEISEKRVDAIVTRGLSAEYKENGCDINLQNELDLGDDWRDYGVVCHLSQEVIEELEPYFTDIIAKNAEVKTTELHAVKEIRDADIALMYYLQQNNYCHKNNETPNQGE